MELRSIIISIRKRRRREDLSLGNSSLEIVSSHIPDSVFLEILYKLPVRSIFRFKCVSKTWLSMISHPSFARSYYNNRIQSRATNSSSTPPPWTLLFRINCNLFPSPEDPRLYVVVDRCHPVSKSEGLTLRYHPAAGAGGDDWNAPMFVLAVSNGLLLSSTSRSSHGCYYIGNPLTKQWAALPKPPRIHKRVSLGFIVEPCDGSFQVVRIGGYVGSLNILNFEIFSSKTRQWKEKSVSFDLLVGATVSIGYAVSCKKILHWMDHNKIITYDSSQSDDETIRCSLIVLPSDRLIHGHSRVGMIGVCRDKLHYFQLANGIHNPNLSSWELRKYDNGGEGEWFLLHRIRFSEVNPAPLQFVQPLALHPFDSDLVYLRSSTGIACFNLRTKVVKYCIPQEAIIVWWTVFVFVLPPWPTPVLQISPTPV